ncbi:MAG: caspase family protein [Bacteroidales bacterium]|nr:caspase family protein [Bacteroidales bacterium]
MKKVFDLKLLTLLMTMMFIIASSALAQNTDTTITAQSGKPKIQWQNPLSLRTLLKSEEENIKALIKSPSGLNSVKYYLNGVYFGEPEMKPSTTIPGNFLVEKVVKFKPGEHIIYIEASNNNGTVNSESRYILYQPKITSLDSIVKANSGKPAIQWTSPLWRETSLRSPEVNIKALVRSPSGINSILLYINGVKYGEPVMKPLTESPGSFYIEKTIKFDPGEYNLQIEAVNNNGTVKSESRSLSYLINQETPDSNKASVSGLPIISWTNPSSQSTTVRSSDVSIKATVRSTSGLNSVVIYLNGAVYGEPEMKPSPNVPGNFYITKTVKMKPGENNLYIVATNNLGETSSEKRFLTSLYNAPVAQPTQDQAVYKTDISPSVNQPPAAPAITWTNPSNTATTLNSALINITASVNSNSGLSSVVLYLNGKSTGEAEVLPSTEKAGNYVIEKTLNLPEGENKIYLVAVNSTGTTKSDTRSLTTPVTAQVTAAAENQAPPKTSEPASKNIPAAPPVINWTNPTKLNTTLSSADLIVRATVKTISGLNSVILYMNGVAVGEPDMKPSPNTPGSFIIEKAVKFEPGQSNIYLEATNSGGTVKSEIRYFTNPFETPPVIQVAAKVEEKKVEPEKIEPAPKPVSQAPVIAWVSPSGPKTTMDSFNATVKANIKTGSGLNSVLLYLNGISKGETEIKTSPDGSGSFLVEKNVNFGPGENNIYLVATTIDGVTAKSEIRYFTNPSAVLPEIKWATPENPNSIVGAESFIVSASIKSPTDLKSVKLYVNADVQSEDNIFNAAGADEGIYNWENSVMLRKGENSIYIVAMNAAGSARSEKRVIKYEENLTEKRLALVFGNSMYIDKPPLKNPVNDANLMAATLEELGFDVIKRLDATRNDMMSALREFNEKLPDYSVALFYYAGHGNQVDGKNYLIPTDATLEKPGDCKFEAIGVDFIVEEFERYPDNTNVVILDACRDNPFATWSRGETAGFKQISFSSGTIIVFATSEGATAADGRGDNGLFTEVLVKQMLVPQSIFSVVMKTRVEVRRLSNNQQTPMEWNKLNGDFYFRK